MTAAPIVGNAIKYADHTVYCQKDLAKPEYMQDMRDTLSRNGTADQHRKELDSHNNDGTWYVRKSRRAM